MIYLSHVIAFAIGLVVGLHGAKIMVFLSPQSWCSIPVQDHCHSGIALRRYLVRPVPSLNSNFAKLLGSRLLDQ